MGVVGGRSPHGRKGEATEGLGGKTYRGRWVGGWVGGEREERRIGGDSSNPPTYLAKGW